MYPFVFTLRKCFIHFLFYVKMSLGDDYMDCLFCKICDGSIPSNTVYEDDLVKVFLDINPNTNGHMLIVPKNHVVTVNDINEDLAKRIIEVEKKMYALVKEKLNCEGLTIVQNNDYGQDVKHYHVHLIPRYDNDCWKMNFRQDNLKDIKDIHNTLIN